MKVTAGRDRTKELCDLILDAIGPIDSAQTFVDSLAALNAATASLLAHHAPDEALGLENVAFVQATILELYRYNRNAMAEGLSPIGRTN